MTVVISAPLVCKRNFLDHLSAWVRDWLIIHESILAFRCSQVIQIHGQRSQKLLLYLAMRRC